MPKTKLSNKVSPSIQGWTGVSLFLAGAYFAAPALQSPPTLTLTHTIGFLALTTGFFVIIFAVEDHENLAVEQARKFPLGEIKAGGKYQFWKTMRARVQTTEDLEWLISLIPDNEARERHDLESAREFLLTKRIPQEIERVLLEEVEQLHRALLIAAPFAAVSEARHTLEQTRKIQ